MDKQVSVVQPIIVIGMHRSGTSMITRMLERLGLFMGHEKQGDDEAKFFLQENRRIFLMCGATWDNPQPIIEILKDSAIVSELANKLKDRLSSKSISSYLGESHKNVIDLTMIDFPWGWKDPRNTFTLPIWLQLFPHAKVIHIYRHGVDVANSLMRRESKGLTTKPRAALNKWFGSHWSKMLPGGLAFSDTYLSPTLENYLQLWVAYLFQIKKSGHLLSSDRFLEFKYEDFLSHPKDILTDLTTFCDLEASESKFEHISTNIDKDRAQAFRNNKSLVRFAHKHIQYLEQFGYNV